MATIDSWHAGREYDWLSENSSDEDKSEGTWWPIGRRAVPMSHLKWILGQSARWHARQAIALFMSDDLNEQLQAAVSVGTAVELLAKVYLVSISAPLIAEKGDQDTILHLSGRSALANAELLLMKTVGAFDLLRLTKQLHKELPWAQQEPVVLRVRNAAIHMALVQWNELRTAVLQMCRIVESLLGALDLERRDFWGQHAFLAVDALLDEAKTRIAQTIEAKKSAAAARLARMLTGLNEPSRQAVLAALSGRPTSFTDHEESQECPVCGQEGWLLCGVERGKIEHDEDGVWVSREAYPFGFECPVCQFELDVDELYEFDFPREIDLDPEDITEDYYSDYY